jgi:hypothetical protein
MLPFHLLCVSKSALAAGKMASLHGAKLTAAKFAAQKAAIQSAAKAKAAARAELTVTTRDASGQYLHHYRVVHGRLPF